MSIIQLNYDDKERWNKLVETAPAFCLMQSYEWGEFKETQGWKAQRLALKENGNLIAGVQVLFRPILNGLLSVAYIPRGPIIQVEDRSGVEALLSAVHTLAHKSRAIFIKIEPYWEHNPATTRYLENQGFEVSKQTIQPRASIILDLTLEPKDLLLNMHRSTRYNIHVASRNGVSIQEGSESDLPSFYEMLSYTAERNKFPIRPFEYYKQEWLKFNRKGFVKLFFAKYDRKYIGARMAFFIGKYAADLHAASLTEFNYLKANPLLVWETMMWAKRNGCFFYDLWGIPDEVGEVYRKEECDPAKKEGGLWGVYLFKRGFGGKVVYYSGAYDYVYKKYIYSVFVKNIFRNTTVEEILHKYFER